METNEMTPLKAIRAYCIACSNGQASEVRRCPMTKCELYRYRFGKGNKRELTEEQKHMYADRLRNIRKVSAKSSEELKADGTDDH